MQRLFLLSLPLAAPYYDGSHPQEHLVSVAGDVCVARMGHAAGGEFMSCVVNELMAVQSEAKSNGMSAYFPVVNHSVDPWAPTERRSRDPGAQQSVSR